MAGKRKKRTTDPELLARWADQRRAFEAHERQWWSFDDAVLRRIDRIAKAHQPNGRATVGAINAWPNSRNVIAAIEAMHAGAAKVFFALGGNSLSASQVVSRVGRQLGMEGRGEHPPLAHEDGLAAARAGGRRAARRKRQRRFLTSNSTIGVAIAPVLAARAGVEPLQRRGLDVHGMPGDRQLAGQLHIQRGGVFRAGR